MKCTVCGCEELKEIKIIDNDLKRLEKTVNVCDRVDTLDSLKYLKLIIYI